jgi:hypothetical protein
MHSAVEKVFQCLAQPHAQPAGHKSVGEHAQFVTRVDECGIYIGLVKARLPD